MLPPSIYYMVLIFNVIKYLSSLEFLLTVTHSASCLAPMCWCSMFGFYLVVCYYIRYISFDKFRWYAHVLMSTHQQRERLLRRMASKHCLCSRIEWQCYFSAPFDIHFMYFALCLSLYLATISAYFFFFFKNVVLSIMMHVQKLTFTIICKCQI